MVCNQEKLEKVTDEFYNKIENAQSENQLEDLLAAYTNTWKEIFDETKKDFSSPAFRSELYPFSKKEADELTRNLIAMYLMHNKENSILQSLVENGFNYDVKLSKCYARMQNINDLIRKQDITSLNKLIADKSLKFEYSSRITFLKNDLLYKNYLTKNQKLFALKHVRKSNISKFFTFDLFLFLNDDINCIEKMVKSTQKDLLASIESHFINYFSLPTNDILEKLLFAGLEGLEKFDKFFDDKNPKIYTEYDSKDEIPIYLSPKHHFHSIFICPILKQYCGRDNPPMYLSCGHIISKNAVDNLSKKDRQNDFKCPYCPNVCTMSSAMKIKL